MQIFWLYEREREREKERERAKREGWRETTSMKNSQCVISLSWNMNTSFAELWICFWAVTPEARHDCSFHQHQLSLDVARSDGRVFSIVCRLMCECLSANDQYVYSWGLSVTSFILYNNLTNTSSAFFPPALLCNVHHNTIYVQQRHSHKGESFFGMELAVVILKIGTSVNAVIYCLERNIIGQKSVWWHGDT